MTNASEVPTAVANPRDEMPIGTLTGDTIVTVAADASLVDVASILADRDIGAVVVGGDEVLDVADVHGVVSERDIVRAVAGGRDLAVTRASDVASTDIVWADAEATVAEVAEEMAERWVRHVLVEDGGRVVGIVSARDLLATQALEPSPEE